MPAQARNSKSLAAKSVPASQSSTTTKAKKSKSATDVPENKPTAQAKSSGSSTKKKGGDPASDRLQEVLNRLKVSNNIAVDTEGSGLDWRRNHIVGYVLTFGPKPQDSYYVPFRHLGNANVGGHNGPTHAEGWDGKLAPGEKELVEAFDKQGATLTFHHANFDLKFLSRVGYRFRPRAEDTMINACLINEWQGRFSLEFCANVAGVQAKKSAEMVEYLCQKFPEAAAARKSAMGHYWRLPGDDPMAVDYAVGDGTTTWQLREWQMEQLRLQELERVWDVESRLINVLARMSVKGIKVDEGEFSRLRAYIKSEIERLLNSFPSDFNARSPDDVRHWMEKHGCTNWPMTPASKRFPQGQPSMQESWLETHDAGRAVVSLRKFMTLRDTFVQPLMTTHLWNGRVHTNFNQLRNDEFGTITGRLSSDSPNLQAVPKHNEEIGRLFRSIFVPDEGKIWASTDYSQMEPRLLAYYSRCKVLFNGYTSSPPIDAHTAVAVAANREWHNLNENEQKHYRNAYAKRINQTIITGGGKGVLVSKYKVDPAEVDRVWADYFRAMPEIKDIQKRMSKRMRQRGYLITLLGRRCRLLDPNKDYVALNRALQGGNADCMKLKLVEMSEYLDEADSAVDMLNTVHDAVDFQFPEEDRPIYRRCIDIMQSFGPDDVITLDIPIVVDEGEGPNWAIATYGPEKPKKEAPKPAATNAPAKRANGTGTRKKSKGEARAEA